MKKWVLMAEPLTDEELDLYLTGQADEELVARIESDPFGRKFAVEMAEEEVGKSLTKAQEAVSDRVMARVRKIIQERRSNAK